MSKLLVTGGAGFIGSNFIHYWLKNHPDDKIVNLDKLTYAGNLENLKDIEKNPNYEFVKGDITDEKVVNKVMKDIDTVVHFAAESHVDRSILESQTFLKTNIIGTHTLLEAAKNANIKHFHHVSTDEIYGQLDLETDQKFNEQSQIAPRSPYSASKAASDHIVNAYFHTHNLPTTITNTSNNFGAYMFPEKLIPLAITNLLEGKKVPIYGDGKYVRDWVFVDDHCRAIDLVLSKGKPGETYCIGGDYDVNNLEIVKKILKILGKGEDQMEFVKDRPGHDRRYAIDFSKATKELGYKPEHDFDEYLEQTVKWYQENQDWWQKIKSGEYKDYYDKWYNR